MSERGGKVMHILFRQAPWGSAALGAVLVLLVVTLLTPPAVAEESATVEEILGILLDRGLIDEADHTKLIRKHRQEQKGQKTGLARLTDGVEWSGDLRLRYEAFYYDDDSFGGDRDNRYRFRYRARFGFKKKINDWLAVGLRLASGTDDQRSTNRTLGDDEDFDPDPIFIDRAFAIVKLPEVAGIESKVRAGKVANPFFWKHGKDLIVWDGDINPEGAVLVASRPLSENTHVFANLGAFIVDENDTTSDPKVFAFQVGGEHRFSEGVEMGVRASGYEWRSLDTDFVTRAATWGNLASAFDGKARIGEASAFIGFEPHPSWPVKTYGTVVRNFTADSAILGGVPVGEEDSAWGAGIEVGNASRVAKFGFGYFHVEANSVIAQFTDSDLFDGFTNHRGWLVYASRKIAPGVEVKMTFLDSDSIKNSGAAGGPFGASSTDADRKRLQTDLMVNF
jgi:hypothetical protein